VESALAFALALAFVLALAFAVILSASFEREEPRESFDHLNRSKLSRNNFASEVLLKGTASAVP
jgi:hypothetical protein